MSFLPVSWLRTCEQSEGMKCHPCELGRLNGHSGNSGQTLAPLGVLVIQSLETFDIVSHGFKALSIAAQVHRLLTPAGKRDS